MSPAPKLQILTGNVKIHKQFSKEIMKNKIITLLASMMLGLIATSAFAQSNEDNWLNSEGLTWMNGDGTLCWRSNYWTPATANPDCEPSHYHPEYQNTEPPPVPDMHTGGERPYSADTFFDFDKTTLKPTGKNELDELVRFITTWDKVEVIVIIGHTDSIGKEEYNMRLSQRRVETIKAYLIEREIPAETIYAEGKGESEPIATNKTREGRAQNRRVEMYIVGSRGTREFGKTP